MAVSRPAVASTRWRLAGTEDVGCMTEPTADQLTAHQRRIRVGTVGLWSEPGAWGLEPGAWSPMGNTYQRHNTSSAISKTANISLSPATVSACQGTIPGLGHLKPSGGTGATTRGIQRQAGKFSHPNPTGPLGA